jgi:hypothetical protein
MQASARKSGLIKLVIGLMLCAVSLLLVPSEPSLGGRTNKGWMVALVGPFVSLIGVFELLSGVAASDWAANWNYLAGWLKFLVALFAVAALLFMVIAVIVIAR